MDRLLDAFGAGRVRQIGAGETGQGQGAGPAPLPPAPAEHLHELEAVRRALTLRGYSRSTQKVYLGQIRRFLAWAAEREAAPAHGGADFQGTAKGRVVPPSSSGTSDEAARLALVEEYIMTLVEVRRISRTAHSQAVSALRFYFETVRGEPRLALSIPRPKKQTRLPVVLSPQEVARMLATARNLKHRALLLLLYSSGTRVGEIVRLRPEDVDEGRGMIRVRQGKGGKDRYTLLARRAAETLRTYREAYTPHRWLFPGARPERHLTTRSVQRVVETAARLAGISKKVTPHTLRHCFATHLLEGGTNLRIIQELLGHESSRTTQVYTHVARTSIEAVRSPLDNL